MPVVHDDPRPLPHDAMALPGRAAQVIAERSAIARHDVGLILGSGWGEAADLVGETVSAVPAAEVPGFHAPSVPGHNPLIRSVRVTGTDRHALVLGARTHLYEGRGVQAVVHGVRTAAAAGCRVVVITNGAGGINPAWAPGTAVLIADHLNLTATSPLVGATFVDLTAVWSPRLRELARQVDPALPEGVYAQLPGPHYETPAEVRMLATLGADVVGMSTALEAIAGRAAGLHLLGFSLVTNAAAGITGEELAHEDVLRTGAESGPRISRLLADVVRRICQPPFDFEVEPGPHAVTG